METNNWYKTEEEKQLAQYLIGLEEEALKKWFNADSSGYRDLWSKKSFTYYDALLKKRIDSHEEVMKYFEGRIDGKLYADKYEVIDPRVQIGGDMALLTYQLFAESNIINVKYNCIELYQKEENGWQVIHSTWSIYRPMEMDFSAMKEIV